MKVLIRLLTDLINDIKCVSLINQKCATHTTIINLHPNEYSQKLHYYPLQNYPLQNYTTIRYLLHNLGRCVESFNNTLNDLSNKVCVPKKNRRFKSTHV